MQNRPKKRVRQKDYSYQILPNPAYLKSTEEGSSTDATKQGVLPIASGMGYIDDDDFEFDDWGTNQEDLELEVAAATQSSIRDNNEPKYFVF